MGNNSSPNDPLLHSIKAEKLTGESILSDISFICIFSVWSLQWRRWDPQKYTFVHLKKKEKNIFNLLCASNMVTTNNAAILCWHPWTESCKRAGTPCSPPSSPPSCPLRPRVPPRGARDASFPPSLSGWGRPWRGGWRLGGRLSPSYNSMGF